ncbi:family 20 glycosylhydrolase [Bowmanella dokdonensis]|nr:family 20 glycosylhydrolase [Bowmanella dokdonensis]
MLICAAALPLQAIALDQQQLDHLAHNLQVSYKLVDNFETHCEDGQTKGNCYLANLTLSMPEDFAATDWQLYFSHPRPIDWEGSTEFDISHINGDLHRLTPTAEFSGFSGKTLVVPLKAAHAFVSESDIMPNYYLVSEGLAPRVIESTKEQRDEQSDLIAVAHVEPFILPKQYLRSPDDSVAQADAAYLYQYHQTLHPQQSSNADESNPTRIIPSISDAAPNGHWLDLSKGVELPQDPELAFATGQLQQAGIQHSPQGIPLTLSFSDRLAPEAYSLQITDKGIDIHAGSKTGQLYALISLWALLDKPGLKVHTGSYQDAPRFAFRGLHLDVARNFHSKEMVLRLLDQMALVKLNKLHLHLADDEGWRLQIPGLPELTEIGAYRCHDPDERRCLLPQLGSGPHRDTQVNGYYSVQDYKDILKYAKARHIEVIPSLDMPGHSRAAVRAMQARYQHYMEQEDAGKARQYLLTDPDDSTVYQSIQYYHDNTLNPCLDSTYTFVEKVLREIKQMHQQAGLPLSRYHIGADETAGAWKASPACQKLMARENIAEAEHLTAYFVEKVTGIVNQMGIMAGAWSDGLSHVEPDKLSPRIQANIWDTLYSQGHNRAHDFANRGWDTVLSLPDVLYFDFPATADPKEPGYYWGSRSTDTFQVFQFMPDNLPAHAELWPDRLGQPYAAKDTTPLAEDAGITGIQGQLWSETVRHDSQAEYMLYPRLFALAERAWHRADWELDYVAGREYGPKTSHFAPSARTAQLQDWQGFVRQLASETLPRLAADEIMFRLPPPGGKIEEGKLYANALWPALQIEYRTDQGPWQSYQSPVSVRGEVEIRARLPGFKRSSRILRVASHAK